SGSSDASGGRSGLRPPAGRAWWRLPSGSFWFGFAVQPAGPRADRHGVPAPSPSAEIAGSVERDAESLASRRPEPLFRLGRLGREIEHRLGVAAGGPACAVRAVRVEPLALALRVQDPEPGLRVDPGSGDPLPVALVLRGVVVDELLGEPLLARAPVEMQMLHEEARADHPHAVVEPAGRRELADPRVDEREAGLAGPPALELFARLVPARLEPRRVEAARLHVLEPVVPRELVEPLRAAARGRCGEGCGRAVGNRDLAARDER